MTLPADVDLHARPAADFVRTAMGFAADVQVAAGEREAERQEPAVRAGARRQGRNRAAPDGVAARTPRAALDALSALRRRPLSD